MENASKALIIAGGILLAIAIITLGVYTYQSIHNIGGAQDEKNTQEQLKAFNKKYEAYNKSLMYGTDVISVMNMAKEDNKLYGYNINIDFTIAKSGVYVYNKDKKIRELSTTADKVMGTDIDVIKADSERFDDFKRRIFKCTNVDYDCNGRINAMSFTEQALTDKQYEHK